MDYYSQSGMNMGYAKPPRRIFSKILTVLLFLLLIGAVAGVGYLYWQEMDKSAKLEKQVNDKTAEIEKLKSESTAVTSTEYTADFGKFKLTLPQQYVIILHNDGNFEGGPVTSLSIGTKNKSGKQTFDVQTQSLISITATQLDGKFADAVKNALNQDGTTPAKKVSAVKIDGVDAEAYLVDSALFPYKLILFEKNKIFYQIKAVSSETSEQVKTLLDEVIKGFKFQS
jgi:hypothetical protein